MKKRMEQMNRSELEVYVVKLQKLIAETQRAYDKSGKIGTLRCLHGLQNKLKKAKSQTPFGKNFSKGKKEPRPQFKRDVRFDNLGQVSDKQLEQMLELRHTCLGNKLHEVGHNERHWTKNDKALIFGLKVNINKLEIELEGRKELKRLRAKGLRLVPDLEASELDIDFKRRVNDPRS